MNNMYSELMLRILVPTALAFVVGIMLTPFFSDIFYRYRLWKRSSRIDTNDNPKMLEKGGEDMEKVYNHQETRTPRIGGVIVWVSFLLIVLFTEASAFLFPNLPDFRFLSRGQTLLPLGSLLVGAVLGLTDDLLQIFGNREQLAEGVPRKIRIALIASLGILQGLWFVHKLSYSSIVLPFGILPLELGVIFVPFFMVTVLALFSSSIIDGIDGLAPGVLAIIFNTYGFIGVIQGQYGIAVFSFTLMGALLAFLWFNIPPARFYLGETGILALTLPLAVLIFLTNTVAEFLIIGLPLVLTALSTIVQILGRRWFNVRVFRLAPLHHHFEAIGWSREKITMRYWIFSAISSLAGLIIVLAW